MPEVRDFLSTAKLRAYAAQSPSTPMAAALVGGTPIGIIVVWLIDSFALPAPMPAHVAVAVGSVAAAIVARFSPLISRLLEPGGRKR